MCGVEISDLPCLDSGNNLNTTFEEMADIRRQGIAADDDNDPAPGNIPVPPQKPYHNWKRRSVGYWKEQFDRGYQTIYTTNMLLSRIIFVMRQ